MGFLAVVGEIHLINAALTWEVVHLDRVVFLQGRTRLRVKILQWNSFNVELMRHIPRPHETGRNKTEK